MLSKLLHGALPVKCMQDGFYFVSSLFYLSSRKKSLGDDLLRFFIRGHFKEDVLLGGYRNGKNLDKIEDVLKKPG
jgi:hypothetical protein